MGAPHRAHPVEAGDPPVAVDVVLEPMTGRHLDAVCALEMATYTIPWDRGLFESEIVLASTRSYWVARIDLGVPAEGSGRLVGYAGFQADSPDDVHLTNIVVAADRRRAQIATRLLLQLFADARRRNARRMLLEVRTSNRAAQRLYFRFGFAPVGVRQGYYPDTGEDALVLAADGIGTPDHDERLRRLAAGIRGRTDVTPAPPPW